MNKHINDLRQFLHTESLKTNECTVQNKAATLKVLNDLKRHINEGDTLNDLIKATEAHLDTKLSRIEEVSMRLVLGKLKHSATNTDPYLIGMESFNNPEYLKLARENALKNVGEIVKKIKEILIKLWEKFVNYLKSLFTKMKDQVNQIKSLKKKINKMHWENYLKFDFSDPDGIFSDGGGGWGSGNQLKSRNEYNRSESIIKSLARFNEKFFKGELDNTSFKDAVREMVKSLTTYSDPRDDTLSRINNKWAFSFRPSHLTLDETEDEKDLIYLPHFTRDPIEPVTDFSAPEKHYLAARLDICLDYLQDEMEMDAGKLLDSVKKYNDAMDDNASIVANLNRTFCKYFIDLTTIRTEIIEKNIEFAQACIKVQEAA